jgi:hypothetical protein
VTVTLAVLVPVVVYVRPTDAVLPVRLSVPDQLYAYTPVPPPALAVQVAVWPTVTEVGETEQDAVRAGTTVTVASAVPLPPAFEQVRV